MPHLKVAHVCVEAELLLEHTHIYTHAHSWKKKKHSKLYYIVPSPTHSTSTCFVLSPPGQYVVTVIEPGARERDRECCLGPSGPHLETVTCPEAAAYHSKQGKGSARGLQPNQDTFTLRRITHRQKWCLTQAVIFDRSLLWFSLKYISRLCFCFCVSVCTTHCIRTQISVSVCGFIFFHSRFFVHPWMPLHLPVVYIISRFQSYHIFWTPHESVDLITHPGPCKLLAACCVFPQRWSLEAKVCTLFEALNSSLGFYCSCTLLAVC